MTVSTMDRKSRPDDAQPAVASGRYVYCILDTDRPDAVQAPGLCASGTGDGSSPAEVAALTDDGLAAIISATSCTRYELNRGNLLTHQRVMEALMQAGHNVLPVKFNTIAEDRPERPAETRILDHVLRGRAGELRELLAKVAGYVELGVKGLWTDMNSVYAGIAASNPRIRSLRQKLQSSPGRLGGSGPNGGAARLGEMVRDALVVSKTAMKDRIVSRLTPLAEELRENTNFGDPMFANLAMLVARDRQQEVLDALTDFQGRCDLSVSLRCVGPVPPSNFIELVIRWDD